MTLALQLRSKILCVLVALSLTTGARAALVGQDFKISPDVSLDSLTLTAGGTNYLAVWRDLSGGLVAPVMQGATISTTGVVSPAFSISDPGALPQEGPIQRARVAFDGNNFLVVWADNRPGIVGVRGARVSPTGAVIGSDFLIARAVNLNGVEPQVVYSGVDFFVAWTDAPTSGSGQQIFFTRVTTVGVPGVVSSVTPVGAVSAQALDLLIKGPSNEALIVYRDLNVAPVTTRAVRVAQNNTPINDPSGALMFTQDFSQTGLGVAISGAFYNNEYVLLTSKGAQIDCTVGRAWLRLDGSVTLSSNPFAFVGQGRLTGLAEENFPRAFFNGQDGTPGTALGDAEFIFPRNSKASEVTSHVSIKRVRAEAIDRDPVMPVVDTADTGVLNGAVAASIGSQYLVAWMDGRRRAADPPRQTNVFGVLLDNTQVGNELKPFTKPVPLALPLVGIAPLIVQFGFGLSTGQVDGVIWNFGDGSAVATKSGVTHTYDTAGTYVAVYSLLKSGLAFNSFIRIYVEGNDVGGGGGPGQAVSGVPLSPAPRINTQLYFEALTATLNFTKPDVDTFRLTGYFDVSRYPVYYPGKTFNVTLGTKSYAFTLNSVGGFVSTSGSKPVLNFQTNALTGAFVLTGVTDNLKSSFDASGAKNESVSKINVALPVSVSFAGLSSTQPLTGVYTATQGGTGKFNYLISTTGFPSEGYFHVFNGTAVEKYLVGKDGDSTHDFVVTGTLRMPDNKPIVKAATGFWRVRFGNYSEDIPTSMFTLNSGTTYVYKVPNGGAVPKGVTGFAYSTKTGGYALTFRGLPAFGLNASGMPITTQQTLRADMAISLILDLDGGQTFQAGGYLRLKRGDVKKKKWSLR